MEGSLQGARHSREASAESLAPPLHRASPRSSMQKFFEDNPLTDGTWQNELGEPASIVSHTGRELWSWHLIIFGSLTAVGLKVVATSDTVTPALRKCSR